MPKHTINDVARLAGVSKKTVSRVINHSPLLNEATRAKVEKVIAEIGYVPDPQARALAKRRNLTGDADPETLRLGDASQVPAAPADRQLIGLVYESSAAPPLADVLRGMLAAVRGTAFALVVHAIDAGSEDPEEALRGFLDRQRPSGVLLLSPLSETGALARLCNESGCRYVCMGVASTADPEHLVTSEDRMAAAQAIAYLISLGHERIGMVTGPEDSRIAQERELGYLDAMADHDLDRGPALIANGDHSFQSGYSAGQLLLEVSPRPTAILAGNDEMAAGLLQAAARMGIAVPAALSIVGFEDTSTAACLCPRLTTVRVPFAEMATAAALKLIGSDAQSRFTPELVARDSAGPAPR